ncbi:MAG: tetratricopeptide repeat protein, partial [Longimicrobiales bacterium]
LAAVLVAATRPEGARVSWPRRLAMCALFSLGAFAKESVVVLPGLIVAMDAAQGRIARRRLRAYAGELAVPVVLLGATFAAVMLLRLEVLGSITGTHVAPGLSFLHGEHRVLVALRALPEMFRLLFFPADLSSDYAPAVILPVESVTALVALGGALLLSTATLAALTPARPALGLGAAWFAITILPISNLLFPIGVVVAERLLYVPSVGVAIVVAYVWRQLTEAGTVPARARVLALAAILALLGARTAVRNPDWKDTPTIIAALVRDHPESYRAQVSAGTSLLDVDPARGRRYLDMAYRTWPHDPFLLSQLGRLELGAGRAARAIPLLERARALAPFVHETESSLAYGYIAAGRPREALVALDRADRLGADATTSLALRAQAYEALGRLGSAVGAWRVVAHGGEDGRRYWLALARSLARGGWTDGALASIDTASTLASTKKRATLALLEQSIRAGCYGAARKERSPRCADPLAGQQMLLPGQRPPRDRKPR